MAPTESCLPVSTSLCLWVWTHHKVLDGLLCSSTQHIKTSYRIYQNIFQIVEELNIKLKENKILV